MDERIALRAELRFYVGLLALFLVAVVGSLALLAAAPMALARWDSVAVTSGSMEPAIASGDVVVTAPFDDGRLEAGTVVVYEDPVGPGLVTHRVAGREDEGYVTAGDANRVLDSTPLPADEVRGVGRLVVPLAGLPAGWRADGEAWKFAVFGVGLALSAWLARFGVLARYDPWCPLPVRPFARGLRTVLGPVGVYTGRRRRAARLHLGRLVVYLDRPYSAARLQLGRFVVYADRPVAILAVAVALLAWLVPTSSTAARFSSAASNGPNTWAAIDSFGVTRYLKTDGPGNRTSTPVLPLRDAVPVTGVLPNYDTDRDRRPGLFIGNDDEGGVDERQLWSEVQPLGLVLAGTGRLTVWSAMENFQTGRRGIVEANLLDCPAASGACTTFASAGLDLPDWSAGAPGWVERTLDFGPVIHTIAPGRRLALRVDVGLAAFDDMWFAYDTTSYPSVLVVE